MTILTELVQKLISDGINPNDLQKEFEEAVTRTQDWSLWGDGRWRMNTVCSKCGSDYAGICSDDPKANLGDFDNPSFHKNQVGVTVIPFKEWQRRNQCSQSES